MITAPAHGAAGRDGARPRTLVCTKDGVWLWPATPLTQRRGGVLAPLPTSELYRLVASLHGPGVHIAVLERAIARAAALLNQGRVTAAEDVAAGLELPPISYDGAALMKALGRRLGVALPNIKVGGALNASPPTLFEAIARAHDHKRATAQALQGLFVPAFGRVAPANTRFVPDLHPRWPAGQSDGGRFRPRDADGAITPVQLGPLVRPVVRIAAQILARLLRHLARRNEPPPEPPTPAQETPSNPPQLPRVEEEPPPGIGHNRPPPDEPVPEVGEIETPPPKPVPNAPDEPLVIPEERPNEKQAESVWGRRVSDTIRQALEKGDLARVADLAHQLAKAPWLEGQIENIIADQDPPRDLDELIDRAREGNVPGYNRHHIVEQGPQNNDLSQEDIQSPENIALVPTYKHWKITNYYQMPQEETGWIPPREYLRGKGFEERYQFGLRVLRRFEVLK